MLTPLKRHDRVKKLVYSCGNAEVRTYAILQLIEDKDMRKRLNNASIAIVPRQDISATVNAILQTGSEFR